MNPRSKKKKENSPFNLSGILCTIQVRHNHLCFQIVKRCDLQCARTPLQQTLKKKTCGHQGHLTRCECWSAYIIRSTPHYASKLGIFRYAEQMLSRANFVGRIMLIHIDRNHHLHGCCCALHAQHGNSDFLPKTFPLHCPCSARLSSTRNRRKQPGPVSKDGEMWNHVTVDIDVQGI